MALEARERGDRYYTRSKRVREYLVRGSFANIEAWEDEMRREERLEAQEEKQLELEGLHDETKELTDAL